VLAEGIDYDMDTLLVAATAADLKHEVVAWDDPAVDWSRYSLCVVRSTWDYHENRDAFLEWCARVESVSHIANAASLLAWNTDKHYLAELAASGLPVVPTTFVEVTDSETSWRAELVRLLSSGDVVVKPAVSAGSNDTERHSDIESAIVQIRSLLVRGKSVMLQPYFSDVDTAGETGLVFVDGEFSHAFAKGAILSGATCTPRRRFRLASRATTSARWASAPWPRSPTDSELRSTPESTCCRRSTVPPSSNSN
jgi:O-ureido-D-serine cyclo-ligase